MEGLKEKYRDDCGMGGVGLICKGVEKKYRRRVLEVGRVETMTKKGGGRIVI